MDPQAPEGADALRTTRMVWAAMLSAIPLYALVLVLVTRNDGTGEVVPQLRTTLYVLAVASGLIAWQVHRRLTLGGPLPPDQRMTHHLLGWVFCESIAMYGFVLGLLRRSLDDAAVLMVVGVLALLATRPRPEPSSSSR
jgi:F0F1-type ATP synthase membrane subunit c/vacuolar-type H+-ATPase subunit K